MAHRRGTTLTRTGHLEKSHWQKAAEPLGSTPAHQTATVVPTLRGGQLRLCGARRRGGGEGHDQDHDRTGQPRRRAPRRARPGGSRAWAAPSPAALLAPVGPARRRPRPAARRHRTGGGLRRRPRGQGHRRRPLGRRRPGSLPRPEHRPGRRARHRRRRGRAAGRGRAGRGAACRPGPGDGATGRAGRARTRPLADGGAAGAGQRGAGTRGQPWPAPMRTAQAAAEGGGTVVVQLLPRG